MSQQSVTTDVHAPREEVFAVLADVERWPQWMPEVKGVEVRTAADGVGAQYGIDQGWLGLGIPMVLTVTEHEAPARLVLEQRQGTTTVATYQLDELPDGGTRVQSCLSSSGPVSGTVGAVFGSTYAAMLTEAGEALRERCEGGL